MPEIRVVIVDGQQLVRAGFSLILQAQDEVRVLAEGSTAEDAVRLVHRHQPDVLLLAAKDGAHRDYDAAAAVARIRILEGKQPRVILLVGSRDGDLSAWAREIGADDVLGKYATPEQIVALVHRVAILPR